ncbi:MAG: M50 family metallopeptidase [Rikenellaceae bacterium]
MKYLYYPIIVILLALAILEFVPVIVWFSTHLSVYQWMLYGAGGYFIIRRFPFFNRNESWLQTFAHELSHTIVSLLFLQKIHSFRADEYGGVIQRSGSGRFSGIFISLAPYSLPYLTFMFLLLRIIGANNTLYVFDIFIGFTYAFHCVCFWKQTRPYQTDIQSQGYLRSYLFIATTLIFNTSIILLSIRKGVIGAVCYLFTQYWSEVVYYWGCVVR